MRVLGEKRNIGDAGWLAVDENLKAESVKSASPVKQRERVDLDSVAVTVTARKRTNADRIITPRKGRQSPVKKGLLGALKESPAMKIPLNDLKDDADEKPVRRRKSLRKSTRRLTLASLEENAPSEQSSTSEVENPVRVFTGAEETITAVTQTSEDPQSAVSELTFTIESPIQDIPAPASQELDSSFAAAHAQEEPAQSIEEHKQDSTSQDAGEEPKLESPSDGIFLPQNVPSVESSTAIEQNYEPEDSSDDVEMSSSHLLDVEQSLPLAIEPETPSIPEVTLVDLVQEAESPSSNVLDDELETPTVLGDSSEDLANEVESQSSTELVDEPSVSLPEIATRSDAVQSTDELPEAGMSPDSAQPDDVEVEQNFGKPPSPILEELVSTSNDKDVQLPVEQNSLELEFSILKSVEETAPHEPLPSEIPSTPKTRKQTPQRRATRRSTRSTRASSSHIEDQTTQEASMYENLPTSFSTRSASPRKSSLRKRTQMHVTPSRLQQQIILETPQLEALPNMGSGLSLPFQETTLGNQTPQNMASVSYETLANTLEDESAVPVEEHASNLDDVHPVPSIQESASPKQLPNETTEPINSSETNEGEIQSSLINNPHDISPVSQNVLSEPNMEARDTQMQSREDLESESPLTNGLETSFNTESNSNEAQADLAAEFDRSSVLPSVPTIAEVDPFDVSRALGNSDVISPSPDSDEITVDALEDFEPINVLKSKSEPQSPNEPVEELPESSTPNPSTTELVEAISENAPARSFDNDDTDVLRNFLTRVKANKAAKAEEKATPKRKRSLPHSPLRIPLGDENDANSSPSSPKDKDEFDVSLPSESPAKRRKRNEPQAEEEVTEPRSIRRSGRTRLPVKTPIAAPSFIPVRRLGQDGGDNTITIRRTEEKVLADLTRMNTRKNKSGASAPAVLLAKKAEEKDDPAARQRALKEVFDDKERKSKKKKGKSVVWAEELAHYQATDGKKVVAVAKPAPAPAEPEKEKETAVEEKKQKKSSVPRMKSKIALGMAANGTPAPKRKRAARS